LDAKKTGKIWDFLPNFFYEVCTFWQMNRKVEAKSLATVLAKLDKPN